MRMRNLIGPAMAAAIMATAAFVQAGAPTAAPPATAATIAVTATTTATAPQDPFTQDLLSRLNSADPAQRDAARKQLGVIANLWQQPEILKQMSEATTDKEIQALIEQRLNELKAKQAQVDLMHLPPISLNVSGATLPQLATALNDALNPPLKIMSVGSANLGNWTLDVKDKPFWDVFAALTQQQALSFSSGGTQLRLMRSGTAIRRYALDGPAIAYVNSINYSRSVALQTPTGERPSPASLSVTVIVAADPRVRVTRFQNLSLLSATDDAGNTLARPGMNSGSYINTTANQINQSLSLTPPENLGKTLSLTLESRIMAQATDLMTSISDVQNNVDKPVTLGGRTFRVARFDAPAGGAIQLQITATTVQPQPGGTTPRVTYQLTDGTGRSVWSATSAGSLSAGIGSGAAAGPYKLEIRMPDKTIELPLHFELKDIPLP
jgi:hypothetical protein